MPDKFRVNHINYSSDHGGAAIAAHRLHSALVDAGVTSTMTVAAGQTDKLIKAALVQKTWRRFFQRKLSKHLYRPYAQRQTEGFTSLGYVSSGLGQELNRQSRQIVNLHWINFDMISIAEIGALKHPVVWTLHDMWPFSGAEHYSEKDAWSDGYASHQKRGFDLNRWVWKRKAEHWRKPMQIVCPSRWLADCARRSQLMKDWPIEVIPNAIDTEIWQPGDQLAARASLGLSPNVPVVLFGAVRGPDDPRKGFAHLVTAMQKVHSEIPDVQAVVFGSVAGDSDFPFPVHFMGEVTDKQLLRLIYSAADVLALPSRQDNLPNTGVEAMACGVPIAGFDIGGLPDLVPSNSMGHLARPFDEEDLAQGIVRILRSRDTDEALERASALYKHVQETYDSKVVAAQYKLVYERIWRC
ncbi:glycosyltransferase [Ruegeria sp. 2205SS24-7]|uniref:glycosyltransferase n=1 Tax=Ruegeria discodermiae TaxID=3064389 RepID=UPI002741A982|nr:glycosyltransferase [Ruegeria sp. 2205SS24-7]MDP5218183.1 glycosyltransferase [Ruegeria sp. 2205SS24-7]